MADHAAAKILGLHPSFVAVALSCSSAKLCRMKSPRLITAILDRRPALGRALLWSWVFPSVAVMSGCQLRAPVKPYVGNWVMKGQATGKTNGPARLLMTLQLQTSHHHLEGILLRPEHFHEEDDGTFNGITPHVHQVLITGQRRNHPLFDLTVGERWDRFFLPVMLVDQDHLVVAGFPGAVPPWRFERVQKLPTLDLPN